MGEVSGQEWGLGIFGHWTGVETRPRLRCVVGGQERDRGDSGQEWGLGMASGQRPHSDGAWSADRSGTEAWLADAGLGRGHQI